MILDMQDVNLQAAEVMAAADWAYAQPVRVPVRETITLKGSVTGGRTVAGAGTPDDTRNNQP